MTKNAFIKTLIIGFATAAPAALLAWIFGGLSVMYGVAAGFAIALAGFTASLVTVLAVSGDRPASSMLIVLFSFPARLLLIGLALFLVRQTGTINIYATVVSLVVVYTEFAFSGLGFGSLKAKSQST